MMYLSNRLIHVKISFRYTIKIVMEFFLITLVDIINDEGEERARRGRIWEGGGRRGARGGSGETNCILTG